MEKNSRSGASVRVPKVQGLAGGVEGVKFCKRTSFVNGLRTADRGLVAEMADTGEEHG
jgi:hypothetical protein